MGTQDSDWLPVSLFSLLPKQAREGLSLLIKSKVMLIFILGFISLRTMQDPTAQQGKYGIIYLRSSYC